MPQIQISVNEGITQLKFPAGRILQAAQVQEIGNEVRALEIGSNSKILVDLSDVIFLNSAVLNYFFLLIGKVKAANADMVVVITLEEITEIFRITNISKHLMIKPTIAAGQAFLNPA